MARETEAETWLAGLHLTNPLGWGPWSQPPQQPLTQLPALLPVVFSVEGREVAGFEREAGTEEGTPGEISPN